MERVRRLIPVIVVALNLLLEPAEAENPGLAVAAANAADPDPATTDKKKAELGLDTGLPGLVPPPAATLAAPAPTTAYTSSTTAAVGPSSSHASSVAYSSTLATTSTPLSTSTLSTYTIAVSSSTMGTALGSNTASLATTASTSVALAIASQSASQTSASSATTTADAGTGIGSNQTLVITLTTVLCSIAALLIISTAVICWRFRGRRLRLFGRGLSPIDDEEIESWRAAGGAAEGEKSRIARGTPYIPQYTIQYTTPTSNHARQMSATSVRKPPSVIIYHDPSWRSYDAPTAGDFGGSVSRSTSRGRPSLDRYGGLQGPALARAPNARTGLTDETIPGAEPFVPGPRRQPSRLSKQPPVSLPRSSHTRTRSSRSSFSFRPSMDRSGPAGTNMELSLGSPSHDSSIMRVQSSSTMAPRLSLGDDVLGGLSPRPLFPDELIGRAIG